MVTQGNITADTAAPSITEDLCEFLGTVKLSDIPESVVERSNYLTLDGIACLLVGAKLPWSEVAVESICDLEGTGSATVYGWDRTVPPSAASLLNGTFIQSFELDDYHEHGPLHSASIVLPAAFAMAEAEGSVSGETLARALLLAFETGPRLGVAMDGYAMIKHGWHCGAVYGAIAGAVAAGGVLDLDAGAMEDCIGIAATQACGLMSAQFESMVKRMNHAFGARNGVLAAALARSGYVGIKRVLEREFGGFFSAFTADHETDPEYVTRDLGTHWELERILVKPYASGGTTHPSADAMQHARTELGIRADDVDKITIRIAEGPFKHNGWPIHRPVNPIGAQINIAYVAAAMLLDGAAFVQQFTPNRIDSDDIWEVIGKIEVVHDPVMDQVAKESNTPRATRVQIDLNDGRTEHIEVMEARGTGNKILTNEEVLDKYRALMDGIVDRSRADAIVDVTTRLHEQPQAEALLELLRPAVTSPF